jgi:hypothetical protein
MGITEGLLIVILIVLIYMIITRKQASSTARATKTWDCVDRDTGDITSVRMAVKTKHGPGCKCRVCLSPEAAAAAEQTEYFTGCQDPTKLNAELNCLCEGDDLSYATNEYGAPGMSYKDWVAAQAVDPAVVKNHAEWVKDRVQEGSLNVTGRTYSPDSHDSYDPISWIGIRGRPQAVATCNPDQTPDVNYDLYEDKPKMVWRT